jgi:serine protease Do
LTDGEVEEGRHVFMNGIVLRLAGIKHPETKLFHQTVITIGTQPDCDLPIDPEGTPLPLSALLIELSLSSGLYRITSLDPEAMVTRHGEPAAVGDPIHDGDTFYFGESGVRLRIFALAGQMELAESLQLGTAVLAHARQASVPEVVEGAPPAPRTDVAIVFVKQLIRELIAEIPRRLLYAVTGAALLILLTIIYANTLSFIEGRRNNRAIKDLEQSLGDFKSDMGKMRDEVRTANEKSQFVLSSLFQASNIVATYGSGICLVYGTYSFYDPRSGREVRFKEPTETSNPIGPGGTVSLSPDGNGPVYEVEFIGTGFLVSKGLVLTNRHVVQPWTDDPVSSMIRGQGFRPKVKELFNYFPNVQQPFTLREVEVDRDHDLALCVFEQGSAELPALPLDEKGEGAISGQVAVLLGYPGGVEGLLARSGDGDRAGFSNRRSVSLRQILNELALRQQISPQSTQGHIGDISVGRLVYDAQTGEGGSGGPVFGANGKVIGINQAILPGTPSNFGIPIRYGIELLKKHAPPTTAGGGTGGSLAPAPNLPSPN